MWKKLLIGFAVSGLISVLLCVFVLPPILGPRLKSLIESEGSKAIQGEVKVEAVKVSVLPPSVQMKTFSIKPSVLPAEISVNQLEVRLGLSQILALSIDLSIDGLDLKSNIKKAQQLQLGSGKESSDSKAKNSGTTSALPVSLDRIKLVIRNSKITLTDLPSPTVTGVNLKNLALNLEYQRASGEIDLDLRSLVQPLGLPFSVELPLQIQTQSVYRDQVIEGKNLKFDLGGFEVSGSGVSKLSESQHDWKLLLNIPALEKLPVPPAFLPGGQWQGSVLSQVHFFTEKPNEPQVQAKIQTSNLKGNLKFAKEDLSVSGPTDAKVDMEVIWNKSLKVPKLEASLNLNSARVEKKGLFLKPAGVSLGAKVSGQMSDDVFTLSELSVELAQIRMQTSGVYSMSPQTLTQFAFEVPPVSLSGIERIILPLSQYPFSGQVQVKGWLKGSDPHRMQVGLETLNLKGLKGAVNYQDKEKQIAIVGSLAADIMAQAHLDQKTLKSASAKLFFDLSGMKITYANVFSKTQGSALRLDAAIRQQGLTDLNIDKFSLVTSFARGGVSGRVRLPEGPTGRIGLDLTTRLDDLSLAAMKRDLPSLGNIGLPAGQSSANLRVTGTFDPKLGAMQSPLAAEGNVNLEIPDYRLPEAKPGAVPPEPQETSASTAGALPLKPLVPDLPLTRNSKLSFQVRVGEVKAKNLKLERLNLSGKYDSGSLQSTLSVQDAFRGSVQGSLSSANLLKVKSSTRFDLDVKAVELKDLLSYGMPQWSEMAEGRADLKLKGETVLPPSADPLKDLKFSGQAQVPKGRFRFSQYLTMAREKLSKIPGVGEKVSQEAGSLNSGPLESNLNTAFSFAKETLDLKNLMLKTTQKDEIQAQGTVNLDKKINMKGAFYLNNPPVKGSIYEANRDESGRLKIPFEVRGDLMSPGLDFAEATIKQMLAKTLEYETKKAAGKVKSKLKEELDKKLPKELTDKFKGFFGQ